MPRLNNVFLSRWFAVLYTHTHTYNVFAFCSAHQEEFRNESMEDVMLTVKGCDLVPSGGEDMKVLVPLESCEK